MTDLHELARRLRELAESDRIDGFYSERGCDEHEAADFIESMAKAEKVQIVRLNGGDWQTTKPSPTELCDASKIESAIAYIVKDQP